MVLHEFYYRRRINSSLKEAFVRRAMIMALTIVLAASFASAMEGPAGGSQVVMGFTGGSIWHPDKPGTGTCLWYIPLLGKLGVTSSGTPALFSDPSQADRAHAYLIWVSDFSVVQLPNNQSWTPILAPAGTATIYFNPNPTSRIFTADLKDRSTWGIPVATFIREPGMVASPDGLATDSFIFTATLQWSQFFTLNGEVIRFRDLMPNGMTCFESGLTFTSQEAGSCVAVGAPQW